MTKNKPEVKALTAEELSICQEALTFLDPLRAEASNLLRQLQLFNHHLEVMEADDEEEDYELPETLTPLLMALQAAAHVCLMINVTYDPDQTSYVPTKEEFLAVLHVGQEPVTYKQLEEEEFGSLTIERLMFELDTLCITCTKLLRLIYERLAKDKDNSRVSVESAQFIACLLSACSDNSLALIEDEAELEEGESTVEDRDNVIQLFSQELTNGKSVH